MSCAHFLVFVFLIQNVSVGFRVTMDDQIKLVSASVQTLSDMAMVDNLTMRPVMDEKTMDETLDGLNQSMASAYVPCPRNTLLRGDPCPDGSSLKSVEHLGASSFGVVWLVKALSHNEMRVLKVPKPKPKPRRIADIEIKNNRILQHLTQEDGSDFVAKMVSSYDQYHSFVSEFAGYPMDILDLSSLRIDGLWKQIICDGLRGLSAIEKAGLVHGDISPGNAALHQASERVRRPHVKFFDFGNSALFSEFSLGKVSKGFSTPEDQLCFMKSYPVAAEALGAQANDAYAHDIFQWGCVAVWLVTGKFATLGKDMEDYVNKSKPDTLNEMFAIASRNYRKDAGRGKTASERARIGSCAREPLEAGANLWHPFVRSAVRDMVLKLGQKNGLKEKDLVELMALLLDDSDSGLLSAFIEKRPHGTAAIGQPFCASG